MELACLFIGFLAGAVLGVSYGVKLVASIKNKWFCSHIWVKGCGCGICAETIDSIMRSRVFYRKCQLCGRVERLYIFSDRSTGNWTLADCSQGRNC